jgi:hypothetical protein
MRSTNFWQNRRSGTLLASLASYDWIREEAKCFSFFSFPDYFPNYYADIGLTSSLHINSSKPTDEQDAI